MKYTYAISLADYRGLHPPATLRAGRNAGFRGALAVCVSVGLLGIFCLVKGLGLPVGCFLISLGALAAGAAYFLDLRSVQRQRELHERSLVNAYRQVHCRDQRVLETDENGFSVACACGVVSRPWSELKQVSENAALFLLRTKADAQIIPKSAFHSEAEITEFRSLVRGHLDSYRQWTSRPVDFALTSQDFRRAYLVHVLKGGGWRPLLGTLLPLGASFYTAYWIWTYVSPRRDVPMLCAFYLWLAFMWAWRLNRGRRKPYTGPIRVHFSEDGLVLEDRATVARNSWQQFIGYLEDHSMFLLYYNPRLHRIVPKRALDNQEQDFRSKLKTQVPSYDYRMPFGSTSSGVPARSGSTTS